jgi:hypothetical protein
MISLIDALKLKGVRHPKPKIRYLRMVTEVFFHETRNYCIILVPYRFIMKAKFVKKAFICGNDRGFKIFGLSHIIAHLPNNLNVKRTKHVTIF